MKYWCVLLAVVTSLTGTCFAQEKPTAKNDQKTKPKQVKIQPASVAGIKQDPKKPLPIKFSMSMLESGRIDPKYMGYSAVEVIVAIENLMASSKGEFESTADYNARKATALETKFLADSSVEDIFAFTVPVKKRDKHSELQYEFNADTGDVSLYVLPKSSNPNGIGAPDYKINRRESRGLDEFTLSTKIESDGTYQASNAYGAAVTVSKTVTTGTGIAVNRIPFLKFERDIFYASPVVASQFKLDNSLAAVELPDLKALIVMKLSSPYVIYNFSYVEPKRSSPIEITRQDKLLTGDVLGIIYYSGRTGDIFARLPETFDKPKVEAAPNGKWWQ